MYLVDTDVISESRKGTRANPGVRAFFRHASREGVPLYVSAITVGELRRGIEKLRHCVFHAHSTTHSTVIRPVIPR